MILGTGLDLTAVGYGWETGQDLYDMAVQEFRTPPGLGVQRFQDGGSVEVR
jgi:hypothetical protein